MNLTTASVETFSQVVAAALVLGAQDEQSHRGPRQLASIAVALGVTDCNGRHLAALSHAYDAGRLAVLHHGKPSTVSF